MKIQQDFFSPVFAIVKEGYVIGGEQSYLNLSRQLYAVFCELAERRQDSPEQIVAAMVDKHPLLLYKIKRIEISMKTFGTVNYSVVQSVLGNVFMIFSLLVKRKISLNAARQIVVGLSPSESRFDQDVNLFAILPHALRALDQSQSSITDLTLLKAPSFAHQWQNSSSAMERVMVVPLNKVGEWVDAVISSGANPKIIAFASSQENSDAIPSEQTPVFGIRMSSRQHLIACSSFPGGFSRSNPVMEDELNAIRLFLSLEDCRL